MFHALLMRALSKDLLPRTIENLGLPDGMVFFDPAEPPVQARIHELLVDAMARVDAELNHQRIPYWLDGGSLLGSVRSGRLIDWDDDIDLGMTRSAFERLLEVAQFLDVPGSTFVDARTDSRLPRFVPASFRLDGTASLTEQILENPRAAPRHLGLAIDVFPFDEVPAGRVPRWVFDRVRLEYWIAENARLAKLSGAEPTGRLLRDRAHGRLVASVPDRAWQWAFRRCILMGKGSGRWGFGPEMVWPCFDLPREVLWPAEDRVLAGVPLPHPRDPHEYLRQHYGDGYLEPPPQAERRTHSAIVGFVPELLD